MKNVFKKALLACILFTGFLMEAAENLDVKVLGNQIVKVELYQSNKGDVLLLMDQAGKILFRDSVGKISAYEKTFNLELVPIGTYYLKLDKENSLLITSITKTENGLSVGVSPETVLKPYFKIENKQVKFFLSNPVGGKAEVRVYDSEEILVGKLESRDLVIQKTLDFSNVPSGYYLVEIEIEGQNFSEKLKID